MNTIIIDDEDSALAHLERQLVTYCPTVKIVGRGHNVREGLDLIMMKRPDLLLLDIQMPNGTGFDLIDRLPRGNRPEVIFVTSQDRYALDAIRRAAIGYLLKPVDTNELVEAIALASSRIVQKTSEERLDLLLRRLKEPSSPDQRISVPSAKGMDFIEVRHITFLEGEDRCTRIHLQEGKSLLSSYAIGEFSKMLDGDNFITVHRSYLVNRSHISGYDREGWLQLSDGNRVPVSRRRRQEVFSQISG